MSDKEIFEELIGELKDITNNVSAKAQETSKKIGEFAKLTERVDALEARIAKLEAASNNDSIDEESLDEAFQKAEQEKYAVDIEDLDDDKTLDKNPKINLFISQPMTGFSNEEILTVRERAIKSAKYQLYRNYTNKIKNTIELYNHGIKIIDNTQFDLPADTHPLEYLANDIRMLKDADYIYFCEGWENSKGCNIEFQIAKTYGIKMMFEWIGK